MVYAKKEQLEMDRIHHIFCFRFFIVNFYKFFTENLQISYHPLLFM